MITEDANFRTASDNLLQQIAGAYEPAAKSLMINQYRELVEAYRLGLDAEIDRYEFEKKKEKGE